MKKKLTLRMDEDVIEEAKAYARERGTSLSKLAEQFFEEISVEQTEGERHSPTVQKLRGVLSDEEISESDYYEYLAEKHS